MAPFWTWASKTASVVGLVDALLEGEPLARWIGLGGFGVVEQFAQVEKVLLTGGAFGEIGLLPLGDELLRSYVESLSMTLFASASTSTGSIPEKWSHLVLSG